MAGGNRTAGERGEQVPRRRLRRGGAPKNHRAFPRHRSGRAGQEDARLLIRDWGKWALVAVLVFVLGAGVWVAYQLVGAAAGPEPELIALLKQTEKDGLRLAVPGASEALVSKAHHFDRFSVRIGPNGDTAEVACTLDFNGRLGATQVSSVGLERTAFEYRAGGWRPVSGLAPLLAQVVGALEARRRSTGPKAPAYQ